MTADMKVTALAPWFGSNRMLAENVGKALSHCSWVGVPFAGGMAELVHISATTIVASDLHCHVINLANVVKDSGLRTELIRQLDRTPFHAGVLDQSQEFCKDREKKPWDTKPDLEWAFNYFCSMWIGRSNLAGQVDEFHGGISARWNSNGGDSNRRFRSAIRSLVGWGKIMRRCSFRCMDGFDLLAEVKDEREHGVYCDPPFPGPGARYKHNCGKEDSTARQWHQRLRDSLVRLKRATVVCRYYDHPLVRELYPESEWNWNHFAGRKQSNASAPEVLLINRTERGLF